MVFSQRLFIQWSLDPQRITNPAAFMCVYLTLSPSLFHLNWESGQRRARQAAHASTVTTTGSFYYQPKFWHYEGKITQHEHRFALFGCFRK